MQRDWNAGINILLKAKSRDGQSPSNASGVGTSTLLGANKARASSECETRIPRLPLRAKTVGVSIIAILTWVE